MRIYVYALLPVLSGCSDFNPLDRDPFSGIQPMTGFERPVSSLSADHASAKGIWRIDGEKSATPYNVSEIWCWREDNTCHISRAELADYGGSRFLETDLEVLTVSSWGEEHVTFKSSGGCRAVSTTLSKKDGSVVQTVTTDLTLKTCKTDGRGNDQFGVPLLKRPRIVRMITSDEWRERREKGLE